MIQKIQVLIIIVFSMKSKILKPLFNSYQCTAQNSIPLSKLSHNPKI